MSNKMNERKKEMEGYMEFFQDMPDRLLKYNEILLLGKDASPYSYQDTMSMRGLCIAITAKCNKKCKYCYRYDPAYKDVLNLELPFEKLEAIVKNTTGKFRFIHLAGLGEPLMYPRIYDAIKLVKKLSDKVRITTNASFLNPEVIDKLSEAGLTDIEMSIWTFDEKEEKEIRGVELQHSIDNAVYISNNSPIDLQINTLVSSENYDNIFKAVDMLKDATNINFHTIPLFETKQARENGVNRVSKSKFKKLLYKIREDIEKYNLNWKLSPSPEGSAMDPTIEMKIKKNICFTCFEDPYINEKGELLSCVRLKPLGGLDATVGFEKVWNHPDLVKFRKDMLSGDYPTLCGEICYLKEKK